MFNEAAPVSSSVQSRLPTLKSTPKTMSSRAVHKPIALRDAGRGEKNEIFVDVIDRISATFNASGAVRTFSIDGSIQMKCVARFEIPLATTACHQLLCHAGRRAVRLVACRSFRLMCMWWTVAIVLLAHLPGVRTNAGTAFV